MSLIAAAIGAGAALVGGAVNAISTEYNNRRNANLQSQINAANIAAQERINQQNIDYMRSMTQKQWERDDTAFQRQVADLEAAGLSPLLAGGQGAGNSSPVSSPALQATQQFPASYRAPQLDMNSVINAISGLGKLEEQHNENLSKANYRTTYLSQRSQELSIKLSQLDLKDKELNQQKDLTLHSLELQREQFEHTKNMDLNEFELKKFCERARMVTETYIKQMPSDVPTRVFTISNSSDLDKFEILLDNYYQCYSSWASTANTPQYKASASNAGKNGQGGISGAGFGVNFGAGVTNGQFNAESKDKNQLEKESFGAFAASKGIYYPIPVYKNNSKFDKE